GQPGKRAALFQYLREDGTHDEDTIFLCRSMCGRGAAFQRLGDGSDGADPVRDATGGGRFGSDRRAGGGRRGSGGVVGGGGGRRGAVDPPEVRRGDAGPGRRGGDGRGPPHHVLRRRGGADDASVACG